MHRKQRNENEKEPHCIPLKHPLEKNNLAYLLACWSRVPLFLRVTHSDTYLGPEVECGDALDQRRDAHRGVPHAEVGGDHLHVPPYLWERDDLHGLVEPRVDLGQDHVVDKRGKDGDGLPGTVLVGRRRVVCETEARGMARQYALTAQPPRYRKTN